MYIMHIFAIFLLMLFYYSSLFVLDKVTGLSATGEAKLRWQKDQTQYKQAKQQERYGMAWHGIINMILWHFTRCGKFSRGFRCLSVKWKLYTCRNSNREHVRKIHQIYGPPACRRRFDSCRRTLLCTVID